MRSMGERSTLPQQISTSVDTSLEGVVGAYSGGNVNTIHPEPEIHEQIYMTKGYGTMCTTTSTFSPTLRPM